MIPADVTLLVQLDWAKLPVPEREARFHPTRRWRFDFAWPEQKVAVEVEGGVYVQGRHSRGKGYEADIEKYNEAALLGWTVLRCTPRQVNSGQTVEWIRRALALRA